MLVITRKTGERFHIGDDITVTVVENRHGKTRLGIDAPANIQIEREELRAKKEKDPRK